MEECLICLEELENEICVLSCNHKYHFDCLKNWIEKTNSNSNICCICEKRCEIINVFNLNETPKQNEENNKSISNVNDINSINSISNSNSNLLKNENKIDNKKYNCCVIL